MAGKVTAVMLADLPVVRVAVVLPGQALVVKVQVVKLDHPAVVVALAVTSALPMAAKVAEAQPVRPAAALRLQATLVAALHQPAERQPPMAWVTIQPMPARLVQPAVERVPGALLMAHLAPAPLVPVVALLVVV